MINEQEFLTDAFHKLSALEEENRLCFLHPILLGDGDLTTYDSRLVCSEIGLTFENNKVEYCGENLYKIAAFALVLFAVRDDHLDFPIFMSREMDGILLKYNEEMHAYAIQKILSNTNTDKNILDGFLRTLQHYQGEYLISEREVFSLIKYCESSSCIILALHDYTVEAMKGEGKKLRNFHFNNEFFEEYKLNEKREAHILLYLLAKEQRIDTHGFKAIYEAIGS